MKLLVTFHSVNAALVLAAAGKERGFCCVIIPVPRTISSSCGYAAEVEAEDAPHLAGLLREVNVGWEALWRETGGGGGYDEVYRNE